MGDFFFSTHEINMSSGKVRVMVIIIVLLYKCF